jgi:hypothetical protein
MEEHVANRRQFLWGSGKDDPESISNTPEEEAEIHARFDDLDGVVAQEIHEAHAVADQQRIQALEGSLREALADIAARACAGEAIGQEELDALPMPPNNHFLIGRMPESVRGPGCPGSIFMSLGMDLAAGRRPTTDEIDSIAGERARGDDSLRAARDRDEQRSASDDFARASREEADEKAAIAAQDESMFEQMRMDYVLNLKQLAENACDSPDAISDYDAYSLGGLLSYAPAFAPAEAQVSAEMSGCAKSVFDRVVELAQAHRLGGLSVAFVRQLGQYYTPAPDPVTPDPAPAPQPARYNPPPRPRPCHWVTVSLSGRKECW